MVCGINNFFTRTLKEIAVVIIGHQREEASRFVGGIVPRDGNNREGRCLRFLHVKVQEVLLLATVGRALGDGQKGLREKDDGQKGLI